MGMIGWVRGRRSARAQRAILAALSRSQAVVELAPDGTIRSVNERFLAATGWRTEGVVGQPHGRFFPMDDAEHLWRKLSRGEPVAETCRAVGAGGLEAWFKGVYIPVTGTRGDLASVLFYGADISDERSAVATREHRVDAVDRTHGVVEFSLDGMVMGANDVFLSLVGYRLDEILGKHHSLFVEEAESRSDAYIAFWRRLRSGLHDAGLYRRLGKGQCVVWIQATYNPIFDANGRPVKIVKYAAEVSAEALGAPTGAAVAAGAGSDGSTASSAVADVLDLIDGASLRADTLAMDAAIDAAFAERRNAGNASPT